MGAAVGKKNIINDYKLVSHYDVTSPLNHTLSEVEVLVVAGGGGGGTHHGGGGGGGGVVYSSSYPVSPGTLIAVTIGNGGTAGTYSPNANGGNGQNSSFGNLTATGGGGGGTYDNSGNNGGSGGAGNNWTQSRVGGTGIVGQGNRGASNNGETNYGGGGGGAGGLASGISLNNGGSGLPFSISGELRYYGGGGGAGIYPGYAYETTGYGFGGIGGGGNGGNGPHNGGTAPGAGTPNTGGGGGGVADLYQNGGVGGSGVVIVRYPGPQKALGGIITQVNGYTIHTFNSSGSFTPTTSSTIYGLYDLTEKGNHLQLSNTTYNTAGIPSLVFNGTSSHGYNYTATNPLTSNAATIILWIKPNATQNADTYNGIFAIGIKGCPYGSGYGETFLFSMKQNRTLSMAKWCDDSTNTTTVVSSSAWSMVSCVKNGATTRFGVNTTFENTANTGTANFRGSNITLGCTDSPGRYYTGEIAVAMLFDAALSDSQITEIYNSYSSRFA